MEMTKMKGNDGIKNETFGIQIGKMYQE